MNVLVGQEGFDQQLLVGYMGQDAQFHLAVVGGDELPARRRNKGAADLAADLGADRDVLQVGVAAAQAPRHGAGLVEAGVHAAGLRVDQGRQRIDIGAAQLFQLAMLQDQVDGTALLAAQLFAQQRQPFEHVDGGGEVARGRLLQPTRRELQLVKQHLAQLLRAAHVEGVADTW